MGKGEGEGGFGRKGTHHNKGMKMWVKSIKSRKAERCKVQRHEVQQHHITSAKFLPSQLPAVSVSQSSTLTLTPTHFSAVAAAPK